MARLLLIPCSHVNREGEIALRACYIMRNKHPRKVMIVTPPTIGVSPLLLESFGIGPGNYVAVNGCGRGCVDRLLNSFCQRSPGRSITLFDGPSEDPRSALGITDDDVLPHANRIDDAVKDLLSRG